MQCDNGTGAGNGAVGTNDIDVNVENIRDALDDGTCVRACNRRRTGARGGGEGQVAAVAARRGVAAALLPPPLVLASVRGGRRRRRSWHAAYAPRVRSPARGERREREALRELGLPADAPHRLCVVDPLAPPLLLLEPVLIEAGDVELVEVVRARRGGDRRHEARDRAAYARCERERGGGTRGV